MTTRLSFASLALLALAACGSVEATQLDAQAQPDAASCPGSQVACGGECIDPATSNEYCGASGDCEGGNAGEACATGATCNAGACECPAGEVVCDGACVARPTGSQAFGFTGLVETFTVPDCVGLIRIDAAGAQGGTGGGFGARLSGVFEVTPGQVLSIVVGQQGLPQTGGDPQNSSGGGGGSFVYDGETLYLAAGGGGGKCNYTGSVPLHAEAHGQVGPNGGTASPGGTPGAGGTDGNGGAPGDWFGTLCSGGGTGWLSPGGGALLGGQNAAASWVGGDPYCSGTNCGGRGGFGGGGGGGNLYGGGGGGGGYSGGGGGADPAHGGGGGSFNAGALQVNIGGAQAGHGEVVITW
jgi:hypothetical protein